MSDLKVNEIKTDAIKNVAGTTSLNIGSTGVVLMPNRPAFNVQITIAGPTNSSNIFANNRTVHLNQGSHWQASGANEGKFVAPVAGLYYFELNGFQSDSSNNNGSQQQWKFHFTKNGNTLSDILGKLHYGYCRYQDHSMVYMSEIVVLAANDAVGVRTEQGYLFSSSNDTRNPSFSGYLIG